MENLDPIGGGSCHAWLDLRAVADKSDAKCGVGLNGLDGTGNNRPGCVITAHRVQRDLHLLFLLLFHVHNFPALIVAAIGANAVRQHRLVALRAVLHLNGLDMQMASPLALPGVRRSSLRNCHWVRPCQIRLCDSKEIILEEWKMSVKVLSRHPP